MLQELAFLIGKTDQKACPHLLAVHARDVHVLTNCGLGAAYAIRGRVVVVLTDRFGNRTTKFIRGFFKTDAAGGALLIFATLAALVFSNTALTSIYDSLLKTKITILVGEFGIDKPLLLWINDGLMAIFFLLVGLELKRELLEGQLSERRRAALPVFGALGGMIIPALIYAVINGSDPVAIRGWAIPAATDIAFALGILALLGTRVPIALKIFLLALAIIDDVGAIIIIALFYTEQLSMTALLISAVGIVVLAILNNRQVNSLAPYLLVGGVVWLFLLKSGVHATLAGVVTALFVPHRGFDNTDHSLLLKTEHNLKPWVTFAIMPVFAFANAGVTLGNLSLSDIFGPISIGIALGLFIGKQLGIMSFVWIAVKTGMAELPRGLTWAHLYGASLLAGIGFTMSLFIGTLAWTGTEQAASLRVGVLLGSIASGLLGYFVLRYVLARQEVCEKPGDESRLAQAGARRG